MFPLAYGFQDECLSRAFVMTHTPLHRSLMRQKTDA
jgi:hypothetical protein